MGKHTRGSADKGDAEPDNEANEPPREKQTFWHRRVVWLCGLATAVLAGVLATSVSGFLPHIVHLVETSLSSPSPRGVATTPGSKGPKTPRPTKSADTGGSLSKRHQALEPLKMMSAYPLDGWEVWAWIFPRGSKLSPGQIAQIDKDHSQPSLVNQDLYDDGAYAPFTATQLAVRNRLSSSVNITDIRVLKSCQSPLNGTIFDGRSRLTSIGPSDVNTELGFNLDSPDPEAMVARGWDVSQWKQEYASGPTVSIPGKTTHVFDIKTIALHHACKFSIQLTIVDSAGVVYQTFNDYGQPFRVSAPLPGVLKREKPRDHPFDGYQRLYVGGPASPWHDGTWVRENPKTWH
jgi:hypothetical protein